jgi:hypothetical protein
MSALGHKRTFWPFTVMSALPPKADIHPRLFATGQRERLVAGVSAPARAVAYRATNATQIHKKKSC